MSKWGKIFWTSWFLCCCGMLGWDLYTDQFGWQSVAPFGIGLITFLVYRLMTVLDNSKTDELMFDVLRHEHPDLSNADIKALVKKQREEWHI